MIFLYKLEVCGTLMLQDLYSIWKKHGIQKVYLFGSYARKEQTLASDIDFLIEHSPNFSLLDLIKLQLELEKKLQIKVDIISNDSVSKFLKDSINRDKILIYSQNEVFEDIYVEKNKF